MKKLSNVLIALTVVTTVFFAACTKSKNNNPQQNDTQLQLTVTQNSSDEFVAQSHEDNLTADINLAAATNPSFEASSGTQEVDSSLVPGAVVDRRFITASLKAIKIIYTGASVFGAVRTGTVTIELVKGNNWRDAGAELKITLENVKVEYAGNTYNFNGIRYITNVSGGLVFGLLKDTVIHKERVNATVKFKDNTVFSWWAARKNIFIKSKASFASFGDTLVNSEVCAMGGTTRFSKNFLIKSPEPIVSNLSCGFGKPVFGVRIFSSDNFNSTITFGVEANGTPVTQGNCAYGYKVEWTKYNNETATLVVRY